MSKSISSYFTMWKIARSLNEQYAADIGKEQLAHEQFVISQHAVLMMTKTPAANDEEVRMKLQVANFECGFNHSGEREKPIDVQLKLQILEELESLISSGELDTRV